MSQPVEPATTPAPAPHPIPVPAPALTPAPAPQPPAHPVPAAGMRPSEPGTGDDLPYYQEGVAWRNLPPDQQTAYWMHRARKHEDRVNAMRDYEELKSVKGQYDQLLAASQTEHERAVAEARRQGEQSAMARANPMLVEAYVRSAAAARGVDDDAVQDFLDTSRLDAFINTASGQVDTAKVYRQVNRLAPAPAAAVPTAGVPAAPAMLAPTVNGQVPQPPATPGWPQQQPVQGVPGQPGQQLQPGQTFVAGQPQWYGQQPVPAAPQWPGHIPAAPSQPGQPAGVGGPDYGQGQFTQAPPSGLEAGRAAARARFGKAASNSQAT